MSAEDGYYSDEVEVLDDEDIIQEIAIDEEELPDQDADVDSDGDIEVDDSVYVFRGHSDELYTVACHPTDASLVATGGKDDKGFLWKIGSTSSSLELQGHKDTVSTVAFSSDGQFLASGSLEGLIQVWNTSSGSFHCVLEGPESGVEWLKWHPKGNFILAGTEDSSVWMWDVGKKVFAKLFSGHSSCVTCGDFTPDGRTICTGSDDATLRIWNAHPGKSETLIHTVGGYPYHTDGLTCLSMISDTVAITGSKDGSIHMVNITTGRVVSSLNAHTGSVECIGVSRSGLWAATGGMDQKLIIWDVQLSSVHCTCGHEEGLTCLTWLGTSRFVATGCVDGKVRVWDSRSGSCMRTFNGHADIIQSLAVSENGNGNSLVSVSSDGTARVFEISEFL